MNKINIAVSLKKQSIHKEGNTNIVNTELEHCSLYDKGIEIHGTLKEQERLWKEVILALRPKSLLLLSHI